MGSEICSTFWGVITNSFIEAGATFGIGSGEYHITSSRIGSRANIVKGNFGDMIITDSFINGAISLDDGLGDQDCTLTRVYMEYGATISDTENTHLEDCRLLYGATLSGTEFYTYKLYNTIIDYDATRPVLYDLSEDTTLGGIGACAHIAGTLRVATGTWSKGEFLTGTLQDILANGINVTRPPSETGISLTVKSSGWYNIDYNASASANAMVLEFQCFIGANAITQSYKKVSYPAAGQNLNTGSSFMVYLTSGQTVDLKYKHDKGSYEDIIVANITITANKN
jgi:hypothetical protein